MTAAQFQQRFAVLGHGMPHNVDIYADATIGNDANPGTATQPVLTLERALLLLPVRGWTGRCRIHLSAGTFDLPSLAACLVQLRAASRSSLMDRGSTPGSARGSAPERLASRGIAL